MSEPFLGQVTIFAGNFAPRGWAFCDGQLLPISQYSALFSILGTTYGGDGRTTFALPDLRGRTPIGPRNGPGLSDYRLGQQGGSQTNTLTVSEMPSHNHSASLQTYGKAGALGDPVGLVTSGGTGSISHAVLAYRDHARATHGITRPNFVKPETGHPAFDKACHLFGVELRVAPVDPATTRVDVAAMAELIDDDTIAILGSAGNYPYGTIDDIEALSDLALSRGVGLHVDGCLGGFILPFGEELGVENIPVFDFRLPGVTTISADTHKYGYSVKGTSVCLFRDRAVRNSQYFFRTDWSGGKYCSPGMDGSRSGGLLAATWASMVSLGREGYRDYARQIFDTAEQMRQTVLGHPELRLMGQPTFVLSFTSDEFDIYLVNDFMRLRGWRFNGQQYPNAIHIAVTRPQTLPGVTDRFAADLAEAVVYAREATERGEAAASGAIYGGVAGGMTDEADEFIRMIMSDMMDTQQSLPPS